MNGYALDVSETHAAEVMVDVACGKMDEASFVDWTASNSVAMSFFSNDN
jgi:prophage maintenance system killer protein